MTIIVENYPNLLTLKVWEKVVKDFGLTNNCWRLNQNTHCSEWIQKSCDMAGGENQINRSINKSINKSINRSINQSLSSSRLKNQITLLWLKGLDQNISPGFRFLKLFHFGVSPSYTLDRYKLGPITGPDPFVFSCSSSFM